MSKLVKLVLTSNLDDDCVNHVLLADNVVEYYAQTLADAYNEKYCGNGSTYYCKVKPLDYKLHTWEP